MGDRHLNFHDDRDTLPGEPVVEVEDRVLLYRVGGGHLFVHRELQRYLSERSPENRCALPDLVRKAQADEL